MLDKFSEELKTHREKNGITIQQIAQKSRIDLKFIEAIDRGDFSFLPELYVKAFIKQYAKMVGLDEKVTINKYEAAKQGKAIEDVPLEPKAGEENKFKETTEAGTKNTYTSSLVSTVKSYQENIIIEKDNENQSFLERLQKDKILLSGIIGSALIITGFLAYLMFFKSGSDIIVAEKPYDEIQKENQQRFVENNGNRQDDSFAGISTADSLTLAIYSSDTCWIKIESDGRNIQEFMLYPNSKKNVNAAKKFVMIIGNSGSTKLELNNRKLNLTGKLKEIKYLTVDKNGISYLSEPPTFK